MCLYICGIPTHTYTVFCCLFIRNFISVFFGLWRWCWPARGLDRMCRSHRGAPRNWMTHWNYKLWFFSAKISATYRVILTITHLQEWSGLWSITTLKASLWSNNPIYQLRHNQMCLYTSLPSGSARAMIAGQLRNWGLMSATEHHHTTQHRDKLCDLPGLLSSGYQGLFSKDDWLGYESNHPTILVYLEWENKN